MKKRIITLGSMTIMSSILSTSCDKPLEIENINNEITKYEKHSAISIKKYLSQKDWEYANFIKSLVGNILDNQEVAVEFAANPTEFIKKHGYTDNVFSINNRLNKLISALADKEIRSKLETKDYRAFMRLCKERGYVENYSGNIIKYLDAYKSLEDNDDTISEFYILDFAMILTLQNVAWVFKIEGIEKETPAIEILLLTEEEKNMHMICEQYIEDEIDIIIDFVKEENQHLSNKDILELTNLLKKNMTKLSRTITN